MENVSMKMQMVNFISIAIMGVLILACKNKEATSLQPGEATAINEEDLYRPNFHFTPKKGWMNDPNGMFFYNEYYHLFYQHYPDGNKWGPMHWGHAISTDMVRWQEQPIALYPDELGYIFSGSAVVDHENTSGFGTNGEVPIVAIFTYHDPKKEGSGNTDVQTQGIAYSLDEGLTWIKYEENPVLKNPGIPDFRDPKVFWDARQSRWVMTLAAGQETQFYASKNLKEWEFLSVFGTGIGNHEGVWECPDLFPLQIDGTEEIKWVHLVSINPGGPNGGSATQYFIGDFDGTSFTIDEAFAKSMAKKHTYWVDFGKDNYAGVTWSDIPATDGRRLFMGWMSNWQYANDVPTFSWRSAMTVARKLHLMEDENGYRLKLSPVKELRGFRGKKFKEENVQVSGTRKIIGSDKIDLAKAEILFEIKNLHPTVYTFTLSNEVGDELVFGYNHENRQFFINRGKAGNTGFSENFGNQISLAPRAYEENSLKGTIILDKTSLELFFDDGKTVMTEIHFPNSPYTTLNFEVENEEVTLDLIEVHEINTN